jgi:hypothetical protein
VRDAEVHVTKGRSGEGGITGRFVHTPSLAAVWREMPIDRRGPPKAGREPIVTVLT